MTNNQIKLIVGLGNPGAEYHRTRHNVGFDLVETLSAKYNSPLSIQAKFHAQIAQIHLTSHSIRIAKPTTFMNLSGQSVAAIAQFHKISPEEILVVHDELDLPAGSIRLKFGGGHGGHNGLRSIIQQLGNSKEFARLRIGIGHPGHKSRVHGYVLSKASPDDRVSIDQSIDAGIAQLNAIALGEHQKVMRELHSLDFGPAKE